MCEAKHESLIGCLYGELTSDEQRSFDTHLATCEECRGELKALRSVRDDLVSWAPPECRDLPSSWAVAPAPPAPMARLTAWAPAFALAAAAMLVLAASASIANLEVRYDDQGFVVRTGRPADAQAERAVAPPVAAEAVPMNTSNTSFVTPEELAALERRLRASFSEPSGMQAASVSSSTPRLPADVRRLIEASEERTRNEMATRFLEIVSDFEGHRRADMLRVQQALGQLQRTSGAEAAQTREIVNRLMLVSSGQQQQPR